MFTLQLDSIEHFHNVAHKIQIGQSNSTHNKLFDRKTQKAIYPVVNFYILQIIRLMWLFQQIREEKHTATDEKWI